MDIDWDWNAKVSAREAASKEWGQLKFGARYSVIAL